MKLEKDGADGWIGVGGRDEAVARQKEWMSSWHISIVETASCVTNRDVLGPFLPAVSSSSLPRHLYPSAKHNPPAYPSPVLPLPHLLDQSARNRLPNPKRQARGPLFLPAEASSADTHTTLTPSPALAHAVYRVQRLAVRDSLQQVLMYYRRRMADESRRAEEVGKGRSCEVRERLFWGR